MNKALGYCRHRSLGIASMIDISYMGYAEPRDWMLCLALGMRIADSFQKPYSVSYQKYKGHNKLYCEEPFAVTSTCSG